VVDKLPLGRGLYEFTRASFGQRNSGQSFVRVPNQIPWGQAEQLAFE